MDVLRNLRNALVPALWTPNYNQALVSYRNLNQKYKLNNTLKLLLAAFILLALSKAGFASCLQFSSNQLVSFSTTSGQYNPQHHIAWHEVKQVVDGDTIQLADGQFARLLGINTPEIGRYKRSKSDKFMYKPDQPLAQEARNVLVKLLQPKRVGLVFPHGVKRDKYHRLLALAVNTKQQFVNVLLISEGLAWYIAMEPRTASYKAHYEDNYIPCLQIAEQQAKAEKLGIWSQRIYQPVHATASKLKPGFQEITGLIQNINQTTRYTWINLQGAVVLRLDKPVFTLRKGAIMQKYASKQKITARGWLIARRKAKKYKPFMMPVKHQAMLFL